ncbi:MAG TPA: M20/M25/M40 family metallo-hydrolase [Polyangiales bacterium]
MKKFVPITPLCALLACGTAESSLSTDSAEDAGSTSRLDARRTGELSDDVELDGESHPLGASCSTTSASGLMACVDGDKYQQHLRTVTGVRTPGSTHWQQVQDYCAAELSKLGFTVERQQYATGVNVIGVLPGGDLKSEQVVISAHYDHIAGCMGADDNASGVAGALEAARVLAQRSYRRTLAVACWDEEERGLLGSRAWADRAKQNNVNVKAGFVFEMIGYKSTKPSSQSMPFGSALLFPELARKINQNGGRGDFVALIANDKAHDPLTRLLARSQEIGLLAMSVELTTAQTNNILYSPMKRSDHAAFWGHGWGGIMIGDTGNFRNTHYHCLNGTNDDIPDLDQTFATQIVSATVGAAADTLELR